MGSRFTLYVDESGEAGINKVRTENNGGASPYMTLGAALVANRSKKATEDSLEKLKLEIGKNTLHCNRLKHYQLLHFSRSVAKRNVRFFGVISRKATLGSYKGDILSDSSKYYNKCTQYLLERVGWFMEARDISPDDLDIVFEKANIDYKKMKNLLRACQRNPKHSSTRRLQNIDIEKIFIRKKNEEPLLQIADLVAHALYKCVDKQPANHFIPEPRYLRELAPRFFGNPEKEKVVGAGIYCVHSAADLRLDADVKAILDSLVAVPPSRRK